MRKPFLSSITEFHAQYVPSHRLRNQSLDLENFLHRRRALPFSVRELPDQGTHAALAMDPRREERPFRTATRASENRRNPCGGRRDDDVRNSSLFVLFESAEMAPLTNETLSG